MANIRNLPGARTLKAASTERPQLGRGRCRLDGFSSSLPGYIVLIVAMMLVRADRYRSFLVEFLTS